MPDLQTVTECVHDLSIRSDLLFLSSVIVFLGVVLSRDLEKPAHTSKGLSVMNHYSNLPRNTVDSPCLFFKLSLDFFPEDQT